MFSPEMEVSREAVGVAGTVQIPYRFVWPHGGSRVLLTGSFTGWSEHLPMYPLEGCSNVFQAICSLTPGHHQYKFCVDGEWRHDDHQHFVMGSYGIVNTVFIPSETDLVPPMLGPETPNSRSNMDVENEAFHHVVTVSDGSMKDRTPSFSDSDLKISRLRISEFLSTHTAYELLADSGLVLVLDLELPVKQAFHILYDQGISVAPLWDCTKGQFVGVLSALDFILILRELGSHGSNLTDEELATHTISAWKSVKRQIYSRMDEEGSFQRRFVHAGPFDSLKDVALKIVQNEISMVPIINSLVQDGSFPHLLHLASLSGILKCICRHFKNSPSALPVLQQSVCTIPLGTWVPQIGDPNGRPLAILRPNASLDSALSLLVEAQVSSIPIVDDNDSLVDTFSRSDITSLAKDRVYERIRLDELSIHQALQLAQDATSPYRSYNGQRCQMCLRTDSLLKVMERLTNPGVRRVTIVEAGSNRVEGIISLRDVFKFLLG